jgi:hypothetical protein
MSPANAVHPDGRGGFFIFTKKQPFKLKDCFLGFD